MPASPPPADLAARGPANAVRVTLFFALAHAALGASLPYLPVWLKTEKGMDGHTIGLVLASASLVRLVVGPLIGTWADSLRDHRSAPALVALLAALLHGALFWAGGSWPAAVLAVAASLSFQVFFPLGEAAIQRATASSARLTYGRGRAVASAVFVTANVAAGALLQRYGADAAYAWILTSLCLLALSGLWLRPEPRPARPAAPLWRRLREGAALVVGDRGFLALAVAAALIQSSHAFYYTFSSTLWIEQGLGGTLVGTLWAWGVLAEIAFLSMAAHRLARLPPALLIGLGGIAALVRWALLSTAPSYAGALALQTLHAGSFALTLVGTMNLVRARHGDDKGPLVQTMLSSLVMAPAYGLATLTAGPLYEAGGPSGYLAAAALGAAGAGLAFWFNRDRLRPDTPPPGR